MHERLVLCFTVAAVVTVSTGGLSPEAPRLEERVTAIEHKVAVLDDLSDSAAEGLVLILFGGFCALWAQQTGRNPWLWFVLGFIFSFVTVFVLLWKNARQRRADQGGGGPS